MLALHQSSGIASAAAAIGWTAHRLLRHHLAQLTASQHAHDGSAGQPSVHNFGGGVRLRGGRLAGHCLLPLRHGATPRSAAACRSHRRHLIAGSELGARCRLHWLREPPAGRGTSLLHCLGSA